jgi:lipoic acid synthetase
VIWMACWMRPAIKSWWTARLSRPFPAIMDKLMPPAPKPKWLRRPLSQGGGFAATCNTVADLGLHTVCQEAVCPNRAECYGRGTATFLLLGPNCTRNCGFCAVDHQAPDPVDPDEPERVARAVARLGLEFCVLTMVTRDDLPGGGASHVAQTMAAIGRRCPGVGMEVLASDLGGNEQALSTLLAAGPLVFNHNLETVPRLYDQVRPQADYRRSLRMLEAAKELAPAVVIKSGLMLGLGESKDEVLNVLDDLRRSGCQSLTLGQYLAPSPLHHPVVRYVPPEEFDELGRQALARGFRAVASAPLVRSSYKAQEYWRQAKS